MPTIQVGPGSALGLGIIADTLGRARKVVVVTGAGISTNCGIPDFRSENGLYSLIQAQYDAALQQPPWTDSNSHDIDDRPKKRRKPWYFYEVVAPSGQVVDVVGGEVEDTKENPSRSSRSPSEPRMNSSTCSPVSFSDTSSLSDPRSDISEPFWSSKIDGSQSTSHQDEPAESEPKARQSSPTQEALHIPSSQLDESQQDSDSTIEVLGSDSAEIDKSTSPSRLSSQPNTPVRQSSPTPDTTNALQRSRSRRPVRREESSILSSNSQDIEPSTQSSQTSRTSLPNLKGRDLFDSMVWSDAFTTSIFYMFISSLRQKINEVESTTETHKFLRVLRDGGRLVRNYTQNIDCLEEREGLCTELSLGPGNRSRFTPKTQREPRPSDISRDSAHCGGVEVVLLHGSLGNLRCGLCSRLSEWDEERRSATLAGRAPDCPSCTEYNAKRTGKGRRGLAVGRLRPDIVLYGEEHPHAGLVSPLITHDLGLGPDVLLIMGTSLKVHGLKVMVKEFAKAVHTKGGKVVFVNRTKPPESTWGDVIDYWVEWDCDSWVLDLKERRSDIWLPQGSTDDIKGESMRESRSNKVAAREKDQTRPKKPEPPRCTRDDRINAVFVTFKILDTLQNINSDNGPCTRRRYWVTKSRVSNGGSSAAKSTTEVQKPLKKAPRKSEPTKRSQAGKEASKPKKRKSTPATLAISDDQTKVNFNLTAHAYWTQLRHQNPSLRETPPEISPAILRDHCANIPSTAQQFAFQAASNHIPNLNWGRLPDLISHPPSGAPTPIHYVKPLERAIERKAASHSYGTRSTRLPDAGTIIVDTSRSNEARHASSASLSELGKENELPTPPKSDPQTPRSMSIEAILSSPVDGEETGSEVWHDTLEVMDA